MSSEPSLEDAIQALEAEIVKHIDRAKEGGIVDISKFPERLLSLHNRVQQESSETDKEALIQGLKSVLDALDSLAAEIRLRYKEVSGRIDQLEGKPVKQEE